MYQEVTHPTMSLTIYYVIFLCIKLYLCQQTALMHVYQGQATALALTWGLSGMFWAV